VSQPKPETKENKTIRPYRWLRRILRTIGVFLLILVLLVIFVRSPWGQDIIVDKLVNYLSDKTNTEVSIEKLFITFDGNVQLDGLYLEDEKGDTLVYSKSLEANIPLWKTINGEAVGVDQLNWDGLKANIIRKDSLSGFNFQFLVDAFASENETPENKKDSEPINLIIGDLNLADIDVKFFDYITGIDSRFKIGNLKADMQTTNLESMIFEANAIALENTNIKFYQKPVAESSDTTSTTLPKLAVEQLSLKKVKADYKSEGLSANADIIDFYTEIPELNLAEQKYTFKTIQLNNSIVNVNMNSEVQSEKKNKSQNTDNESFEWPDLQVDVADLNFENNSFGYSIDNEKLNKNTFNPKAVSLSKITLKFEDLFLKDKQAGLSLSQFSLEERSGLDLKTFSGNFKIDDWQLSVNGLDFQLNSNNIQGLAEVNYNGLQKLFNSPEDSKLNLDLPSFNLSLRDIFKFQKDLENNPYLKTLSKRQFKGNLIASGTLGDINISDFNLDWGKTTQIKTSGSIQNATQPESIQFNLPEFTFQTNRSDLLMFMSEEDLGVSLPNNLKLSGDIKGSPDDISTQAKLESTQGLVAIEGRFKNQDKIEYNAELDIKAYKLDELLNNPQLGTLSLNLKSKGSGSGFSSIDGDLQALVSEFEYNDYLFKDLEIDGSLDDGDGSFQSNYKDDNLNLMLNASVLLDSLKTQVIADLDLKGADLQALGFVERDVKTRFKFNADFSTDQESYTLKAQMDNGIVVYDNESYLLGSIDASGYVTNDTTSVDLKSKIIDINLKSNTDPQALSESLNRHILSYFYRDEEVPDTLKNPVKVQLRGKIAQSPLLNEVFLVNLKDLDTVNLSLDFDEKARRLKANITAPHINYAGNQVDSLKFAIQTDNDDFSFNLGFDNINSGPLDIPQTKLTGYQSENELSLKFEAIDDGNPLIYARSRITGNRDRLKFTVNPDSLTINSNSWKIPAENEAILKGDSLIFNNFEISRNTQSIIITDKRPEISNLHTAFEFKNFNLNEILNYLNPQSELAKGKLNGHLILENPFEKTGIIAEIDISDLTVLDTDLGNLSLDAKSLGGDNYDFDASLKQKNVDLTLTGDYDVSEEIPKIDLDIDINEFKMKALNTLSLGEVEEGKGSFSGQFEVTGTTKNPQYQGQLKFNEAGFKISKLNTNFLLKDEILNIDNDGLSMNNFTIRDVNDNKLIVSGDIRTKELINPEFDLTLKATDFKILDANKEDNELFYGKVIFDADAKLTGDLQIPKLDSKFIIDSKTDFVYVLPSSTASIKKRDGIVTFVNRENPDDILTSSEEQTVSISGFDIESIINIKDQAKFRIILDQETGDNFLVQGKGDLNFRMSPNGRINLSGVYEASSGHYELSLYNLVKRKFLVAPESRVIWNGDPFNAELDVRAIYKLETSASSLMAPQTSGIDPSVKSKYRQVLPFEVYLNIDGELLQPEISFQLDMPEEERGSIGGQVYGRLQQVNQQEAELNRQVFSLLVLNRFYPSPGSDGSSGGIETVARDNLNDAVADQLNAFSDKILGDSGIELDFGLDSYTDYQGDTPTQRTQLNVAAEKKLFNDRLTVRVGSDIDIEGSNPQVETAPIVGNVSLVYELTKDGRYRLKGFRRNRFENVVDGQTIVSGIALIFTQEFNKFDELWKAIFRKSKENADEKSNSDPKSQDSKPEKESVKSEDDTKNK